MFYRIDNNGNDYVGGITAEDVSYEHVQTDAWNIQANVATFY